LYNWMVAYFTKDQSLRMIIKPTTAMKKVEAVQNS
jgi:NADH dehydrogenase